MKRYYLCILLVILVAKIFRADDDEIPKETKEEKKAYHHHCYQVNHTECINTFLEGVASAMKEYKDKKLTSGEVQEELKPKLKPLQKKAYECLNKTEPKKKKCPVGLDRCVTASFTFEDKDILTTGGCEANTSATCFSLLKLDDYEYYTGKKAKTVKCDFCDNKDCNEIKKG